MLWLSSKHYPRAAGTELRSPSTFALGLGFWIRLDLKAKTEMLFLPLLTLG